MKKVAVIMGSDSDLPIAQKALAVLEKMEVPAEVRVLSAHRTPEAAARFADGAKEAGFGAMIAIAGKAAHLAGALAGRTPLPVIGVPIRSSDLGGLDGLLSTVQMPSGVPVATVAIDGGTNAAWLAVRMLALSDEALNARLEQSLRDMADEVERKDKALAQQLAEAKTK